MPEELKTEGWWRTIPGMLTATAGIITALAGLLVALHQVGLLGSKELATTPEAASSVAATAASPAAMASNDVTYAVRFPSGASVKFRNHRGQGTYEILSAQVERSRVGTLAWKFTIRLTNNVPADVGFWSDSFRLLVDGVPRAPVSRLNDAVDARSAKEKDVEFESPETATRLALQVLVGDTNETADIPIALEKAAK